MPILPLLFLAIPGFELPRAMPTALAVLEAAAPVRGQDQSVDELLAVGRKYLLDGSPEDAFRMFKQAEEKDGASLRTHVFVMRAEISREHVEDVLMELEDLKRAGKAGIETDYLFGTAFYTMGARDIANGQPSSATSSFFEDAVTFLKKVTEKHEARFDDAWTTLAEAAWYTQDFELGEVASKKAIEVSPDNPSRRMLRGKLALSAYAAWQGDEAKTDAAEEQWQAAVEAFEKAIALCGDAPDQRLRPIAQQAWTQLGVVYVWKQQLADASNAFTRAIALDPATADYAAISGALQGQDLLDALETARKSWGAKNGGGGDATLVWWLGYANYGLKKLPEAEKAFESALTKNPEFWTSLYYLYRIHFENRDYAKCLATLHRYPPVEFSRLASFSKVSGASPEDPPQIPDRGGLVAALAYDVPGNAARLEALVGWAMDDSKHGGKPLRMEAAFASDLITRIVPREPEYSRHWNNLGLFLRDEGDELRGTQGALEKAPTAFDEARVNKLWEESLAAYEVALEIEPRNPNYLNDTAVMLHYYFVRELERAKAMYQRGYEEAKLMLERKDLSEDTRAAVKIALRDTGNNVKLVQKLIDKRAAEAAAPKGETPVKQ